MFTCSYVAPIPRYFISSVEHKRKNLSNVDSFPALNKPFNKSQCLPLAEYKVVNVVSYGNVFEKNYCHWSSTTLMKTRVLFKLKTDIKHLYKEQALMRFHFMNEVMYLKLSQNSWDYTLAQNVRFSSLPLLIPAIAEIMLAGSLERFSVALALFAIWPLHVKA